MTMRDKFWVWGYTQQKLGMPVPFTGNVKSYCSLETALEYLGIPNAFFLNPMHSFEQTQHPIVQPEEEIIFGLERLSSQKQIISALPHGEVVLPAAQKIADLSLKFPNIKGIVLDDFLQLSGHPTTPEKVRQLRETLLSVNPNLEIHVVIYSDLNHLDITPYLEFIDSIVLWRWVSTEHFWKSEFSPLVHRFKENYGKKLFHGLYIQNYGEYGSNEHPIDLDLWKLQWTQVLKSLRAAPFCGLDGCVLLQNGWLSDPNFRDHVVWLKQTIDWFLGTTTER